MSACELFTTLGVVADWALLFGQMHPAKIPILFAVGTAVTTLLDTLAGRVKCGTGESEGSLSLGASLSPGASHYLGPCVNHLILVTLSDRFFYIQPFDEDCVEFL